MASCILILLIYVYYNHLDSKTMQNYVLYNEIPLHFTYMPLDVPFPHNFSSNIYFIPQHHFQSRPIQNFLSTSLNSTNEPQETLFQKKNNIHIVSKKNKQFFNIQKRKRKLMQKEEERQEQFCLRNKKNQGVTYKRKNTESNIINQTFSFISTQKSRKQVLRMFNFEFQKVDDFYKLMQKIKQQKKKYINRKYLLKLFDPSESYQIQKAFSKCKNIKISIIDVQTILRKLIFYYIRKEAHSAILTSSKINKNTLPELFDRRRQIENFLFYSDQNIV